MTVVGRVSREAAAWIGREECFEEWRHAVVNDATNDHLTAVYPRDFVADRVDAVVVVISRSVNDDPTEIQQVDAVDCNGQLGDRRLVHFLLLRQARVVLRFLPNRLVDT